MAYKKKLKLKTYFTIDELDNIILYLFSQNINITRKSLSNLKTVFESLDERIYEHEPSLAARVFYIKKILDARLRLNINEFTILVNYPKSEYYNDIIETSIIPFIHEYGDLSDGDIQFINTTISDILKYNYLLLYKDDLSDCIDQLEMGNYGDLNRINNNMYEICQTLMKFMRETKLQNEKFAEFDMTDESMNTVLADTLEELKAPSNRLKSGIKFLNKMTGGGFEGGRVYLFFATPGMGKSLLLLTLAYHIAKYNKHLKPKDPNKRLTVLYITQENSLKETISRLWNIAISDDNIINFDFQEVKEAFRQAGLFTDDNTSINIKLQYIPHKQLTVDDMYGKIEEMSDNNEEVIAVIHDYTKRLKNTYPTGDPRIDLGEIINEWQSFAKYFGIPVITAGQINRNGQTIIEDAVQNNQEDIGKKLNAHNIGESFLLYENTDYAYIITREMKASEKRYYLAIKEIKARDKRLPAGEIDIKYFVHPYEQNNPARLCEDLDLKQSLSKLQVSDNVLGGGAEDENGNIIPPSNNNVGRRSRLNNAGSRRRKMEVETVSENSDDLV